MTDFACFLIVVEPMTLSQMDVLADTGDSSGKDFVSVCIAADYPSTVHERPFADLNGIARRAAAQIALEELGVEAYGFDEYGWKELS